MRRALMLMAILALVGCGYAVAERESSKAERELQNLETVGASVSELCAAHRKVALAYLEEKDADADMQVNIAKQSCLNLQMEEQIRKGY